MQPDMQNTQRCKVSFVFTERVREDKFASDVPLGPHTKRSEQVMSRRGLQQTGHLF
jgi:hypothetical protein